MTREGPARRVRAERGEVDVELPETPSSGYRWELAFSSWAPAGVAVTDEFRASSARDDEQRVAGGSGLRVFSFHGLPPGEHRLEFHLTRSWEHDPLETRIVTIESGED